MTCIFGCPIFYKSKCLNPNRKVRPQSKTPKEFDQPRKAADKIEELLARGEQKKRGQKRPRCFASTRRYF